MPSVLWHCWLGIRKSTRPIKKLSDDVLLWLSVWCEVQIVCIWSSWCHCIPKSHRLLPHFNPDCFLVSAHEKIASWKTCNTAACKQLNCSEEDKTIHSKRLLLRHVSQAGVHVLRRRRREHSAGWAVLPPPLPADPAGSVQEAPSHLPARQYSTYHSPST